MSTIAETTAAIATADAAERRRTAELHAIREALADLDDLMLGVEEARMRGALTPPGNFAVRVLESPGAYMALRKLARHQLRVHRPGAAAPIDQVHGQLFESQGVLMQAYTDLLGLPGWEPSIEGVGRPAGLDALLGCGWHRRLAG